MKHPFVAGSGKSTIDFPKFLFPIEGFRGIHDAPCLRVLALRGAQGFVLLAVELVLLPDDLLLYMRKMAAKRFEVPQERVWVHVTHAITTPHAPRPTRLGPGGEVLAGEGTADQRKAYDAAVLKAFDSAVDQAARNLRGAKMGWASGLCHVNANRDIDTPLGRWIGLNGDGASNKEMTVLRFEDEGAAPIAFILSYGIKPSAIDLSQMEAGMRLVSSDVPGVACRKMEDAFGAPTLFLMSAAGDQIPRETAFYDWVSEAGTLEHVDLGVEKGLEIVARLGDEMGKDAIAITRTISKVQIPAVAYAQDQFIWPGKAKLPLEPRRQWIYLPEGEHTVDIGAICLGDVALLSARAEMNCCTERELQRRSPFRKTLLAAMVNGGMKYMPDADSYERCSWEAMNSALMPGAAERYIETAVHLLNRLATG